VLRLLTTPRWLALHLLAVVVLLGCLGLSAWQWHSYTAGGSTPHGARVPIGQLGRAGDDLPGSALRHPVSATGAFDDSLRQYVPDAKVDGRTGFLVITPLVLPDGSAVPVVRGWVDTRSSPAAVAPTGTVTVDGILQGSESEGFDPDLPGDELSTVDVSELRLRWPQPVHRGYVLVTAESPAPAVAPVLVPPPGAHGPLHNAAYALQWVVFGLFAVAFWIRLVRDAWLTRRDDEEQALATALLGRLGRLDPPGPEGSAARDVVPPTVPDGAG
jgi:cytochrome oxidase assembly protein ShyY1